MRCVNAGLGDSVGELRFTSGNDTTNHVHAESEGGDFVVDRVLPLVELCADLVPVVIKLDVEGYEHAVVSGGQRTLAAPGLQAVIMETNSSGHRDVDLPINCLPLSVGGFREHPATH